MKRKLISLVCALSMVVSLFGAFVVVNADSTPAIVGTATKSGDEVTVVISYEGFTKVSAAQFELPVDTTKFKAVNKATDVAVADAVKNSGGILVDNYDADSNTYIFGWSGLTDTTWLDGKGTLATITLTVAEEGGKAPKTISINNGYIKDQTAGGAVEYRPSFDGDTKLTVDEVKVVDPDSTDPLDRPATNDDPEPSAPTVVEGAQIKGVATLSADGNTADVVISYEGFTKVSAAQFELPVDTTKFKAVNKATDVAVADAVKNSGGILVDNYDADSNTYIFGWSGLTDTTWLDGEGTLATITLTLNDDVKLPVDLTINNGYIKDQTAGGAVEYRPSFDGDTKLAVVNPSVAKAAEEPTYKDNDIKLSDIVGTTETGTDDVKTDGSNENPYYVAITATKADGKTPAKYDEDYTAYYNGVKLTEGQLNNYLAGKYGKVSDALKNITFAANEGVTITAELDKVVDGEATTVKAGEPYTVKGGNTKNPTAVKFTVTGKQGNSTLASGKSVNSGVDVVVTPTFTNGQSANGDPYTQTGDTKVTATTATLEAVASPGIKITYKAAGATEETTEYLTISNATTGVVIPATATDVKVSFTTYNVSTTATKDIDLTFETTSDDPANPTPKAQYKLTVNKATTTNNNNNNNNSGGSGSTSSGGGAIASGNLNGGTAGNLPALGFTDMDDADWARDAVNALALRNIVSGRGDGTFDPNGNITRAEYAQILINAIGKQSESADTYFNDVPTDAWFYHNVAVAAQYGIVNGYGDGNFGPYDLITREQMALMTQKAAQVMNVNLAGASVGTFSDDAEISAWAYDAVYTLANAGIINGMGDGTFAPKNNATRAQASVIIYNTFVK